MLYYRGCDDSRTRWMARMIEEDIDNHLAILLKRGRSNVLHAGMGCGSSVGMIRVSSANELACSHERNCICHHNTLMMRDWLHAVG